MCISVKLPKSKYSRTDIRNFFQPTKRNPRLCDVMDSLLGQPQIHIGLVQVRNLSFVESPSQRGNGLLEIFMAVIQLANFYVKIARLAVRGFAFKRG